MTGPRILFVSYGGGHIDIVARVWQALGAEGQGQARLLALTTAAPAAARRAIAHSRCVDYLPSPDYAAASEIGAALSEGIWTAASGIAWEDSCAYMGVSMCDLIADLGEEGARAAFDAKGRAAFCPRRFLGHVMDRERPDIVVTTCNVRMERAAHLEAQRRAIRSVRIEDLFGYSLLGPYSDARAPKLVDSTDWPDDLVVMNDHVARTVVRHGFPATRVRVLGQPVLSDWAASYAGAKIADALVDWATGANPVIVYVAPPDRETLSAHGAAFQALASRRSDLRICLKMHPSVSVETFGQICPGQVPGNLRVLDREDIITVIRAADLTVVNNSTAGLLAAMSGKPMLVLNTSGQAEVIPYVASGVAERVDQLNALEAQIDGALEDQARAKTETGLMPPVPEMFQSQPDAARRIASWLRRGAGPLEDHHVLRV